jgi:hypothetical protein
MRNKLGARHRAIMRKSGPDLFLFAAEMESDEKMRWRRKTTYPKSSVLPDRIEGLDLAMADARFQNAIIHLVT